jgi:hypothetical protein
MSKSPEIKTSRGLTLSKKLAHDLQFLCDHLGINPHSYMLNEVSKAVQRDIHDCRLVDTPDFVPLSKMHEVQESEKNT